MLKRRIIFKPSSLQHPSVYEAMRRDDVSKWAMIDAETDKAEIFDEKAGDFPALREALSSLKVSFDFYSERPEDGESHTALIYSRDGKLLQEQPEFSHW